MKLARTLDPRGGNRRWRRPLRTSNRTSQRFAPNASKYRRLAEERMAADQQRIAATLIEVVAELERRAEDLERFVKS
jgi:hypothetical protein